MLLLCCCTGNRPFGCHGRALLLPFPQTDQPQISATGLRRAEPRQPRLEASNRSTFREKDTVLHGQQTRTAHVQAGCVIGSPSPREVLIAKNDSVRFAALVVCRHDPHCPASFFDTSVTDDTCLQQRSASSLCKVPNSYLPQ